MRKCCQNMYMIIHNLHCLIVLLILLVRRNFIWWQLWIDVRSKGEKVSNTYMKYYATIRSYPKLGKSVIWPCHEIIISENRKIFRHTLLARNTKNNQNFLSLPFTFKCKEILKCIKSFVEVSKQRVTVLRAIGIVLLYKITCISSFFEQIWEKVNVGVNRNTLKAMQLIRC